MLKRQLAVTTALGTALLAPDIALAQTAAHIVPSEAARGTAPGAETEVGDIVVTARRRDESLSKTPVSVAVISADTLAKAQVGSEQDLRFVAPGLTVRAGLSATSLNYSIRGQSQDAYSNSRPGVLPYINEVQIGGQGSATAFYDLQSVQVLKGPQGTLFGRSATGGAVLFTTAKPTETLSGYASALAGDHGARKIEGAISGPIAGDALTARLAGIFQRRHGFQKNLYYGGRRIGDFERYGGRGSVTVNLGSIKNELVVDYFHDKGENMLGTVSGLLPLTGGPTPLVPLELLYAGVGTPTARATGIGTISAFTGAPASVVAPFYDTYFADPRHANSARDELAAQLARGPYVVNDDGANFHLTKNLIVTNATTVELGGTARLKNILGYTRIRENYGNDADGFPFLVSGQRVGECICNFTRQISDELQLQGTALSDRLDYTIGGYFSDEKTTQRLTNNSLDILFGGFLQHLDNTVKNFTYAGYAQGSFKLTDTGLSATAGFRYTSEKVTRVTLPTNSSRIALGDPAPAGYDYNKSATYNKLSWTLGLQHQVDPTLLVYAASRRAYKSGGYNLLLPPLDGQGVQGGDSYGAEKIIDAELGTKFNGELGDVRTRLNAAFFYNWISNNQRAAYTFVGGGPAVLTVNVPKAEVYGLELDGSIQPTPWLFLGGNVNLTKSKFVDGNVNANGLPVVYDRVADTPKFSGVAYADVTIPLSAELSFLVHGDVYRQSSNFTSPRSLNSAGSIIPSYTTANFRLGLQNDSAGWSLTANLKNAFDKIYYVGGVATGESYQLNTLVPGEPRTFTIEARFKF
ncbi:TonB-dependent receptor [Tardibacter chloracetimidivorans]|uniref:TonB-dependent receptor n=1 Tax=Tardibacter chloracetimidivorans TaxID=1921510 RepID=UPI0009FA565B|nr:TonB-dependent receptor plug domain-containing protein [Tardibacter chloracetimidivorans]